MGSYWTFTLGHRPMSEIHVSPIDGENVLFVNGFKIAIEPVKNLSDGVSTLAYIVSRKGKYICMYQSLQRAVEWCSD